MKHSPEQLKKANPFMYKVGEVIGYLLVLPLILLALVFKLLIILMVLLFLASPLILIGVIFWLILGGS